MNTATTNAKIPATLDEVSYRKTLKRYETRVGCLVLLRHKYKGVRFYAIAYYDRGVLNTYSNWLTDPERALKVFHYDLLQEEKYYNVKLIVDHPIR